MKWTTDFPKRPGFYCFDGYLGRLGDKTEGAEIVSILASPAEMTYQLRSQYLGGTISTGSIRAKGSGQGRLSSQSSRLIHP
jgi:hypothetical protein